MITWIQNSWKGIFARRPAEPQLETVVPAHIDAPVLDLEIAPNDPLLSYLLGVNGVVEVERVNLDSPALRSLREAGIKICIPLVSQGELIGLLNLGPRRSEQDYSTDDKRLLTTLATQAAPALRVAQLVRQQQAEALERERIQQELRVARVIQQTLLPKEVPNLPGWRMDAFWKPARAVSGDFYDFIQFPDGKLGVVIADVSDKGMPAALVMATTRSILRSAAEHLMDPGEILRRANDMLYPDIPPNMFVTCLYVLLDPNSGSLRYANAGHNLPFRRTPDEVFEMRARGMPLGLMPDMEYEVKETTILPGENMILYSDGLVEAHNPEGQMFGTPRLQQMLQTPECGKGLIECLMGELGSFTGPGWEQEDDVTFVIVDRLDRYSAPEEESGIETMIAKFSLASQPGNEREAMERVASAVDGLDLPKDRVDRLKTAVSEATMNAMEHGNKYQPENPVEVEVKTKGGDLLVSICDCGGDKLIPESPKPDLAAKLEGLQSPRGWGLFLIKNMVDDMHVSSDGKHHIVELVLHLEGDKNDQ